MTETLDEIMADKLVSLVNTQRYVRHRDIWDLRWLKQAGTAIHHGWVNNKIEDYSVNDYDLKLESIKLGFLMLSVNSTIKGKEVQDIAPDDDPIKAGVIEFDVFGKLIYK